MRIMNDLLADTETTLTIDNWYERMETILALGVEVTLASKGD